METVTGSPDPSDARDRWTRDNGTPGSDDELTNPEPRHPGFTNYPAEDPETMPRARVPTPRPRPEREPEQPTTKPIGDERRRTMPRKLTVIRVAAMRGRELTSRGIATFHRAAKADGAEKSGLTALTYAVMANNAADAALTVALANTLFFSATSAESKGKVALYLVIAIAPFAIIAPFIGPLLDRIQRGRRLALAASFAIRAVLAVVMAFNFNNFWGLYPAALGMLVLSKSFSVLKSALTPRVLPPEIDLVRVNSRLTVFGLLGGTIVAGGLVGVVAKIFGSGGALWMTAVIAIAGAYLSMRIPSWVEVTAGEVPATLTYHGDERDGPGLAPHRPVAAVTGQRRQPLGRSVLTGLWGNGTIRVLTGFLFLYLPFVAKSRTEHEALIQVAILALVGAAAGLGNFAGNAAGARLKLGRPAVVVLRCTIAVTVVAILAASTDHLATAAVATLVAACASALAKVSLDASLQDDLPDESRASAFGRSETVLQLCWVVGGALGVLLPTDYWIGFTVISVLLTIGLVQTILTYRGSSLFPGLGGNRPNKAAQEGSGTAPAKASSPQ